MANYHDDLIERLKDPASAANYLQDAMVVSVEEGDGEEFKKRVFLLALSNIAEAWGLIPPRNIVT